MKSVKKGDHIRLIEMPNDPNPIPSGSEGVVVEVTNGSLAQITVDWVDINRTLSLIPGVDRFEVIGSNKHRPCEEETR